MRYQHISTFVCILLTLLEIAAMHIKLSTFHFTTYSLPVYEKEVPCIILGSKYIRYQSGDVIYPVLKGSGFDKR
jgi:hypothetical protein